TDVGARLPATECEALAKSTTAAQPVAGKRAHINLAIHDVALCLMRGSLLAKKALKLTDILRLYAKVASKLPPTK
ncbi:hypothetical protein, partial [Pseudomonas cichorii]|uniref:hypothetical protein n=1 Tax=Pseudomonas cichorii TaxID=36746 RepID=UPI001E59A2CA